MLAIMTVRQFPPRESFNRRVSFESLQRGAPNEGICRDEVEERKMTRKTVHGQGRKCCSRNDASFAPLDVAVVLVF